MPKKLDYPRASFKACLELADAIENLGGQCDMSTCAAKMGRKQGGAFNALTGSATKFGLVSRKQGTLYISDAYGKMKLSYTEDEKQEFLQKFFVNVALFREIYKKYFKVKLPVDILDKALVKEFDVDKKSSKRVVTYFIEGAKFVNLLNSDNTFNKLDSDTDETPEMGNAVVSSFGEQVKKNGLIVGEDYSGLDKFIVHVYGRGMNSKIEINDIEDLNIVYAMVKKVKKNLDLSGDGHA